MSNKQTLCGFVWSHGEKDFSVWECELEKNDIEKIENILSKYEHQGSSTRNAWDVKIRDMFSPNYGLVNKEDHTTWTYHTAKRIDDRIAKKYMKPFLKTNETECPSNWSAPIWLGSDIEFALKNADDLDARLKEIEALIEEEAKEYADEIRRLCSIDRSIRGAKIRKDWKAALKGVRKGSELSSDIQWGLSKTDIKELTAIHKENKSLRKKIEDLLTDCNFHRECSFLMNGRYEEFEKEE